MSIPTRVQEAPSGKQGQHHTFSLGGKHRQGIFLWGPVRRCREWQERYKTSVRNKVAVENMLIEKKNERS